MKIQLVERLIIIYYLFRPVSARMKLTFSFARKQAIFVISMKHIQSTGKNAAFRRFMVRGVLSELLSLCQLSLNRINEEVYIN